MPSTRSNQGRAPSRGVHVPIIPGIVADESIVPETETQTLDPISGSDRQDGEGQSNADIDEALREVLAEEALLRKELLLKEAKSRVEALRTQVVGDPPQDPTMPTIELEATPSVVSITRDDWEPAERYRSVHIPLPKLNPPELYYGKNIKEWQDWMDSLDSIYRLQPSVFPDDRTQVLYAAQYLRDVPKDSWERQEELVGRDVTSWVDFSEYLRNLVQDPPVNRVLGATQAYERARQRDTQSVQEFVSYLESLEQELDPYSEAHRRQHLFAKLKPSLQRAISNFHEIPTSRSALISLAARIEGNTKGLESHDGEKKSIHKHKERNDTTQKDTRHKPAERKAGYRFMTRKRRRTDANTTPLGQKPKLTDEEFERRKRDNACYACGKPGHFSDQCTSKLKASAAAVDAQKGSKNGESQFKKPRMN